MAPKRSRWRSARRRAGCGAAATAAAVALACAAAAPVAAQDDAADAACAAQLSASAVAECRLAVGAARVIQPRLAAALFAGNPVPGTASTLGMRLGSLPRMSLALQLTATPTELPPLLEGTAVEGERAVLWGFTAAGAVGILTGFSPLPTVGGVLSLDLIGRLGYVPPPGDEGFHDGGVFGWSIGARVGGLRESFTLPGISLTGSYGRIGRTAFGDPVSAGSHGFFDGPVTDLRVGLAATKRLALVGLTAGVAWNRQSSDLTAGFRDGLGAPQVVIEGDVVHERWSGYANASWTMLIFHASAELGWQEAPEPLGLPAGVVVDPVGWFAGVSFRVSI